MRWRGQGAKCLVIALCVGPGGPKVLFGTYSHTRKVQIWGQGGMALVPPPGSATDYVNEDKTNDCFDIIYYVYCNMCIRSRDLFTICTTIYIDMQSPDGTVLCLSTYYCFCYMAIYYRLSNSTVAHNILTDIYKQVINTLGDVVAEWIVCGTLNAHVTG